MNESIPSMKSAKKLLSILQTFTYEEPKLRVIDIARKLNLSQSTVSRYLALLFDTGYVLRDSSGYYFLGNRVITLSGIALDGNPLFVNGYLDLLDLANETKMISIMGTTGSNGTYITLYTSGSSESLTAYNRIGQPRPIYANALGKCLLAFMNPQERQKVLKELDMKAFTQYTITSVKELKQELRRIKTRGYATAFRESKLTRASIAAPVFQRNGELAGAIALAAQSEEKLEELSKNEPYYVKELIAKTDIISGKLGYFIH